MLVTSFVWLLYIVCGSLADKCKDASTVGKTFVFGATHGRDKYYDQETDTLHISSTASGHVTIQTMNGSTTHNISEGLTTIDIPKSLRHDKQEGKQQKSIVITADTDVSAYVFQNYPLYDSSGITLLPTEVLGNSYVVASYEPSNTFYKNYLVVVSFMDKTAIEISLRTSSKSTVQMFKDTLNKFESYYIPRNHDVSGTVVTSSNPVGVFSGVDCLDVPFGIPYGNCDRVDTQNIPDIYQGKDYIVPSMFPRKAYMIRIISIYSDTKVQMTNETDSWSLSLTSRGKVEDIYLGTEPVLVQSDHPVSVYQFAVSHAYDHTPGSEFMIAVPPVSQYSSGYLVPTQLKPNYYTWTYRNFASVIIETNLTDGLLVNDTKLQPVVNQSLPAPKDKLSVVTFELNGTSQNISHEKGDGVKFGLFVYGQNDATGYGFIGGRQFPVSEQTNVALGKPATQSSQSSFIHFGEASRAVDGNRNQMLSAGSCSHTLTSAADSWWMVDLLGVYNISSMTIYNRVDCCSHNLDNAEISYSIDSKAFINFLTVKGTFGPQRTLNMKGIQARYIKVTIHGLQLSLCEVEIYGVPANGECPPSTVHSTKPPVTKYTGDPGIIG